MKPTTATATTTTTTTDAGIAAGIARAALMTKVAEAPEHTTLALAIERECENAANRWADARWALAHGTASEAALAAAVQADADAACMLARAALAAACHDREAAMMWMARATRALAGD